MAVWIAPPSRTEQLVATLHRRRAQRELWIAYALILVVIWTPRPWQEVIYFIAAAFVITTTGLSFLGWRTMGLGISNLVPSSWIVGVAVLVAWVSVLGANHIHTLHSPDTLGTFLGRFAGYIIFACVQQALLQDYFLVRFLQIVHRPEYAALATAAIFSAAHLPNPILVVVTFVWGFAACLHFLQYRSLYPLAIAHAILGITLAVSVPGPVVRNMRVGLGYLTYHPHHHRGAASYSPLDQRSH